MYLNWKYNFGLIFHYHLLTFVANTVHMRYALFALILLTLGACSSPQQPVFKTLENIKFNSITLKKPYSVKLDADAVFHNPNSVGAQIKALDFDVFVNGKKATHVDQEVSSKMPANADFVLPIICSVSLKDVFKDLKLQDLFSPKVIDYKIVGHLTIDLGAGVGVDIPFEHADKEDLGMVAKGN